MLSEGAASLLPDQVRPAFVWDLRLDADGEGTGAEVYRAMVRSTDRLDYEGVQKAVDARHGRRAADAAQGGRGASGSSSSARRGGASLPMPEQEVDEDEHGPLPARLPAAASPPRTGTPRSP